MRFQLRSIWTSFVDAERSIEDKVSSTVFDDFELLRLSALSVMEQWEKEATFRALGSGGSVFTSPFQEAFITRS